MRLVGCCRSTPAVFGRWDSRGRSVRSERTRVLMVGPSVDGRGGVSAVLRGYYASSLPDRIELDCLVSHVDGSRMRKAAQGLIAVTKLAGRLARRRVDVLHLHMASRGSFARKSLLAAMGRAARVPVVIHVHGAEFDAFTAGSPLIVRWWIARTLRRAAAVIGLSGDWAKRIAQIAPTAHVRVVPNGVMVDPPRASYEGGDHHLFVGRLGNRKGAYDLVRAVAMTESVRVVLVGDGEVDELRSLAKDLRLLDRVDVRSWTEGDEKVGLIQSARAFVLPSHAEGLPMALLEAMAAGLPVIATPVGGIPEIVDDGVTGMLISPGDLECLAAALTRLWDDAEMRACLGEAARERVADRFGVERAVEALVALYDEVTAGD